MNDSLEDITQDPEYQRGYEEAKRSIEKMKSPYHQGRDAAFMEDVRKRNITSSPELGPRPTSESECSYSSDSPFAVITRMSQQTQEKIFVILERQLNMDKEILSCIKDLNERLKTLEKCTQQ